MKTSNKLLTGLIVFFFLLATALILLSRNTSYYPLHDKDDTQEQKEETSLNFYEQKAEAGRLLYFPLALLQHSLLKGNR